MEDPINLKLGYLGGLKLAIFHPTTPLRFILGGGGGGGGLMRI